MTEIVTEKTDGWEVTVIAKANTWCFTRKINKWGKEYLSGRHPQLCTMSNCGGNYSNFTHTIMWRPGEAGSGDRGLRPNGKAEQFTSLEEVQDFLKAMTPDALMSETNSRPK